MGSRVFVAGATLMLLIPWTAIAAIPCLDYSLVQNRVEILGDGIARDYLRNGNILYVATSSASEGIQLLDVTDPTFPAVIGVVDVGGAVQSLARSGDWIYAATGAELVILDGTIPSSPVASSTIGVAYRSVSTWGNRLFAITSDFIETFDITSPAMPVSLGGTAAPSGQLPDWTWAFYEVRAVGPDEVLLAAGLVDLEFGNDMLPWVRRTGLSDPSNADFDLGVIQVGHGGQCGSGLGHWENVGTLVAAAYTATSCGPTYSARFVTEDLAAALPTGTYSMPGDETYARDLSILTPTSALWSVEDGWQVPGFLHIDFSDPLAPAAGPFVPYPQSFRHMDTIDGYVYASAPFEVLEYSGGTVTQLYPGSHLPEPIGEYDLPFFAQELAARGTEVWAYANGILGTLDVSDPASPASLGSLTVPGVAHALETTPFGALAGGSTTLYSIDGGLPGAPAILDSYPAGTLVRDIVYDGTIVHAATNLGYLQVDAADPSALAFVADLALADNGVGVGLWDGYAYVVRDDGAATGAIEMIDLHANVRLHDTTTGVPGLPRALVVDAGRAYVATTDGLSVFELATQGPGPEPAPVFLGSVPLSEPAYGIAVADDYAYVGTSADRTFVVEVTDPANPTFLGTFSGYGGDVVIGPQGEPWTGTDRLVSIPPQCGSAAVRAPASAAPGIRLAAAPNPLRDGTTLRFELTAPGSVSLEILDVAGRRVATLHRGPLPAGPHARPWRPARGTSSGVYWARLAAPEGVETRRLVLTR